MRIMVSASCSVGAIQILYVLLNCLGFFSYMVKFVLKYCSEKELLNLKDSKLTQNFYGNKTGFVRLGHICDHLCENRPSSHLVVIRETLV